MFSHAILFTTLLCVTIGDENVKNNHEYPLTTLDRHLTRTLAYHYLWPWNQLMRAAAALELEESLEDASIATDPKTFAVRLRVKNFKPDDLEVRIKNRYIIVEGKRKITDKNKQYMANHFVQSFMIPAGTVPEEFTAYFDEKGILSIQAPRHEVPPPVDIKIPIIVKSSMEIIDKKETTTTTTEKVSETKNEEILPKETPIEPLHLTEATTQYGKIKKKELKPTSKTTKDNEVPKSGDANALEYTLLEE